MDATGRGSLWQRMLLTHVLIYWMACFGFYAVVRTAIRDTWFNRKPFNCCVCISYWVGIPFALHFHTAGGWIDASAVAFSASAFSWILNKYITEDW